MTMVHDLVVIGCGAAGLAAAVTYAETAGRERDPGSETPTRPSGCT